MWFTYVIMWISVACASCYGMYITKSAWCLLAFVIAGLEMPEMPLSNKKNDTESKEDDNDIQKEDEE